MIFEAHIPSEKAQKSLSRLRERFQLDSLPHALTYLSLSEEALNDISMNLARHMKDAELTEGLKLLIALASAVTQGSPQVAEFFSQAAIKAGRSRSDIAAAFGIAVGMGFNNAYYRFRYQVTKEDSVKFKEFNPAFNTSTLIHCPLPDLEREIISVAVSSINNCQGCVKSHVMKARDAGMTDPQLDEAIRIVSIAVVMAQAVNAVTPPMGEIP
jgi:alkyl hydroperoxide reductase subunit D